MNGEIPAMKVCGRLYLTLLAIGYSLFPSSANGGRDVSEPQQGTNPLGASRRIGTADAMRRYLAGLDSGVGVSGELLLRFDGCYGAAAPFLLHLLKKRGFSSGRALISDGGLTISARR